MADQLGFQTCGLLGRRPTTHDLARGFRMPTLFDPPPANVRADLDALRDAADRIIPSKQPGEDLLIATWNLRMFSSLTRQWTAGAGDRP